MKLLKWAGGIWAGLGALNIATMFLFDANMGETFLAFGLVFNVVLFILPGLALYGIGKLRG